MKITVEYSESIQIAEGLWRKIGLVIEDDVRGAGISDMEVLHTQAKETVQRWHQEGGVGSGQLPAYSAHGETYVSPTAKHVPPPVIDRSIERLEILIDDCKTKEELGEVYRVNWNKIIDNESVKKSYHNKLEELSK